METDMTNNTLKKCKDGGSMAGSFKMMVVMTAGILIFFVAAKNSMTWMLQQFLFVSGNFWTSLYESIYNLFGGNEFLLVSLGTMMTLSIFYWSLVSVMIFVDATGKPDWIHKYKIQQDCNIPVDSYKLKRAFKRTFFNNTVISLPYCFLTEWLFRLRGCSASTTLPEFHTVLLEMLVFFAVQEIGFYYSHRLLHHGWFYKNIHKRHHEYTSPFAVSNFDVHPLEHVISNLAPMLAGPIIVGSHVATMWMWFVMGLFNSISAHSGYHLPFLPSNEPHDFHHLKFVNNFGTWGILDRLHGTDALFRESKQYQNHRILLGFTPARELANDSKNVN
ncbi:fatty acid hydroxylase domain-containing protein 2-like [Asterias amurensis]|uniref:fatty acid hydroxylase domain-containing protein 2-like n=1 Tax=Asterias amurensis TaxID=7602 RepID=UPI003AB31851